MFFLELGRRQTSNVRAKVETCELKCPKSRVFLRKKKTKTKKPLFLLLNAYSLKMGWKGRRLGYTDIHEGKAEKEMHRSEVVGHACVGDSSMDAWELSRKQERTKTYADPLAIRRFRRVVETSHLPLLLSARSSSERQASYKRSDFVLCLHRGRASSQKKRTLTYS